MVLYNKNIITETVTKKEGLLIMKRRHQVSSFIFNTAPIDRTATRLAVEQRLEEIRIYRQIGIIRKSVSLTSSYQERFHGATHKISNTTAQAAIYNVDREQQLRAKSELLDQAMASLSTTQQEVIRRSYLDDECEYDFISCNEMGISDRTYRRIKASAIALLAVAMNLEVYVQAECNVLV